MRKLIFVLPIIFMGCATTMMPSARERNEKCADFEEVEIFQTFGDGGLASVCERKSYTDLCIGMTVAVLKEKNEDFWDKKRIKVSKGKCFAYDGVYKYTSKDERDRTVPIIRLDYAYPPASEKEVLERLEDLRLKLYYECLDTSNAEFKKEKDNNVKKCECFANLAIEKIINTASSENGTQEIATEQFGKSLMAEAEKNCGALPKNMKL